MKNLIYLFITLISTIGWNQSFAQETFQQEFENGDNYPILLKRGTEVLYTMEAREIAKITVKEGDRITVDIPNNVELRDRELYGVEPMYMAKSRNRKILIQNLRAYHSFKENETKREPLFVSQNLYGVDIANFDPMYVTTSFKSVKIFKGVGTHLHGYKYEGGYILPIGFSYQGDDNIVSGGDMVSSYSSSRKFEEGYSVGLSGEVPVKKVDVGLGVKYSNLKREGHSNDDIYFSTSAEVKVRTVSLTERDLVDVQLTDDFRDAVKSLNNQSEVKDKIIEFFGTHYPETVTYGGYWRSWKHISSKDYYEMEQQNIDVSATVKLATPGQKIKETTSQVNSKGSGFTTQTEEDKPGASGNVAFDFSHVQKSEYEDKLSRSQGDYKSVGGRGDDATAIKVKLKKIYRLVYPHIFKDGSTEAELKQKREWIKKGVEDYLDAVLKDLSEPAPEFKLYKAKLSYAKKVGTNLDDANQKMKGLIALIEHGTAKVYSLWGSNEFIMINEAAGELRLDENQEWTIIKVPKVNGIEKSIVLNAVINLENLDDCCGNDPHIGSLSINLKDIDGIKDYTTKVTHTAFFEETHWEVKFVIQEIPDIDYTDEPISPSSSNRSASNVPNNKVLPTPTEVRLTEEEFNRAARAVVINIGSTTENTSTTPTTAGTAKEVKWYSQNSMTLAQAQAMAKNNGWEMATAAQVQYAWTNKNLDVYAFGMMADGRFAVPVQSDHSNFKKGANIGAVGGNQGFFYTVSGSTVVSTPPTTTTPPVMPTVEPGKITNIALGKSAKQSSTYSAGTGKTFPANNAVDGVKEGFGKISHTLQEAGAWWEVDLGRSYNISSIKVYNATDIPQRMNDFTILVSETPFTGNSGGTAFVANQKAPTPTESYSGNAKGRYVRLFLNGTNYLTIHEVEVLGSIGGGVTTPPVVTTPPTTTAPVANTMPPASPGYVRIQNNMFPNNYIHNQNGQIEEGPIEPNWLSTQWKIVPYGGPWINIQNRSNPDLYLNNNEGKLEVVKIANNRSSAVWRFLPAQNGWVHIQSLLHTDQYIHNQNGKIELGPIQPNSASAMWKVE